MAHIIADRVADTSVTTGASDFTVSGTAPTGFRTLDAVLSGADTFYYCIEHQTANEWEIGLGTYAGLDVFARTTVLSSSNANSAVTFSAGTKNVFLTHPAARMVDGITMGPTGIWTIDVSGATDFSTDLSNFEVKSSGDTQTNVASTTYSDTMGGGTMHCKFARGSEAAPNPVLSGDFVGGYGARAWHSGGAWQVSSPASIHWMASENQGPANYGMYLRFLTTPKGSTTRQERVIIADTGTLWAHDEATYDPKVETQTKPFPDATILGSRAAAVSSAGSTLAAVHYAGSGTAIPGFRGGAARGTPATPTAVQANDFLAFLGGHGFGATGWVLGAKGLLTLKAAENWTDTANGSYATIETTPIGSTTRAERLRVTDAGDVYLGADSGRKVLDAKGGTITGGFAATDLSLGIIATGTVAPSLTASNLQTYQNDGAHTLAPPSSGDGTCVIRIINGTTAGAITTSGFTKVSGDLFTTTLGHGFFCFITKIGAASHLYVQAMQ